MASYLCDTNLLLRMVDAASVHHRMAVDSLAALLRGRHDAFITAQNLIEFWAVATRPVEANGLGWNRGRTSAEVAALRQRFPFLPDSPDILGRWLTLVETFPVTGKRVHDARLVAVLQAHGVEHLVTFNVGDFTAFTGVSIIHPATLLLAGAPLFPPQGG